MCLEVRRFWVGVLICKEMQLIAVGFGVLLS